MTAHQWIPAEEVHASAPMVRWPVQAAMLVGIAVYIHAVCWMVVPPDMTLFLFPWYEHILESGRLAAFAEPFSNYTPPYLYLLSGASLAHPLLAPLHVIKLLSVAGSAFLVFAMADLLKALRVEPKRALWAFALPTVALNAALLGQCDALWAGACLLAVATMIRRRTVPCLAWCGVAIALKAQAAFLAPLVIGALIGRKAPLWQWGLPIAVYAILMLPAWLLGWPAADLATIYLRQAEWFTTPGNLANPWVWASAFGLDAESWYVAGYAAATGAAAAIVTLSAKSVRRSETMVLLATISALAVPFMLPKMHERYFFLADVLALALALAWPTRMNVLIAVGVQAASLSALISYIYKWPPLVLAGSVVALVTLCALALSARASLRRVVPPVHEAITPA